MASAAKAPVREHIETRRSERFRSRVTLTVCGESTGNSPVKGRNRDPVNKFSRRSPAVVHEHSTRDRGYYWTNRQTWDEVEARVSRLAALDGQGTQVAVEFTQPAPDFWPIGLRQSEFRPHQAGNP